MPKQPITARFFTSRISPPPAARYSRVKIFRYFLTVCCTPATLSSPWHHLRCTHPQHIRMYATNMTTPHSTWTTENIGGTQQNAEHATAPEVSVVPTHTRSATQPTAAPTEPPYEDTISTKNTRVVETRPLPRPSISYCPPWPPPHHKCWYLTNVALYLRRSQQKSYMNNQAYYQRHTTQYGVDLPTSITADNSYTAPPAPTASEKNLLRPP